MQETKPQLYQECKRPTKVLQFGEGNFLRAFIGDYVHELNERSQFNGGIAVIQPIREGMLTELRKQGGAYTLFLNGMLNGRQIQEKKRISNITEMVNPYEDHDSYKKLAQLADIKFIFSNTTESGITFNETDKLEDAPPTSFPAKLTQLLWLRYIHFGGSPSVGLYIIPCELINNNGFTLKEIIFRYIKLWELEDSFSLWVEEAITFCNTLVDRIVPGYPSENTTFFKQQLDYNDSLMVTAEPFFLWVIEGDEALSSSLGIDHVNADIRVVDDLQAYRTQKVRILNGAHTAMVPLSLMIGHKTVSDLFTSKFTKEFLETIVKDEIAPTIEIDRSILNQFVEAVFDRFNNPFLKHYLASIALNSISKFKVRVLPSLLAYYSSTGTLPQHLVFSFACLIRFYQGQWNNRELPVQDDPEIIAALTKNWNPDNPRAYLLELLKIQNIWGQDLTRIPQLVNDLSSILLLLEAEEIEGSFKKYSHGEDE